MVRFNLDTIDIVLKFKNPEADPNCAPWTAQDIREKYHSNSSLQAEM